MRPGAKRCDECQIIEIDHLWNATKPSPARAWPRLPPPLHFTSLQSYPPPPLHDHTQLHHKLHRDRECCFDLYTGTCIVADKQIQGYFARCTEAQPRDWTCRRPRELGNTLGYVETEEHQTVILDETRYVVACQISGGHTEHFSLRNPRS